MYLISFFTKDYSAAFRRITAEEPARFVGKEIDFKPIAQYLDRRRSRAVLQEQRVITEEKLKLTTLQKNIITSITINGYWQGNIDDVLDENETNQLISRCTDLYQPLQNKLREYHYNQRSTVTLDPAYISGNPDNWIIYQGGLNEKLLQIAHQYIGLPVGYHGAEVRLSRANSDHTLDSSGPRSPHFDAEEGQKYPMLKAVLYLTDVTEDNGPFTIYDGNEKKLLTGKKGTLILADTSKYLHHGMPLNQGERMVNFWTYTSHRPRYPHRCIIWPHSNLAVRKMTVNMSPIQQRVARWRESLPISLCPVSYYPFPGHNFYLGDRNRTV